MLCLCLAHSLQFSFTTYLSLSLFLHDIVMCWCLDLLTFKYIYLEACSLACNTLTHFSAECETEQTNCVERPAAHFNVHPATGTRSHMSDHTGKSTEWGIKIDQDEPLWLLRNNISFCINVFPIQPLSPTWIVHTVHDVLEMQLNMTDCHVIF